MFKHTRIGINKSSLKNEKLRKYDARPKMCFSPSPPPPTPKAIFSSNLTFGYKCSSDHISDHNNNNYCQEYINNNVTVIKEHDNMQRPEDFKNVNDSTTDEESTSDYKQWLHAMKLVARLPGGIPPEFRRKLWLSLADKYLKSKNVNWTKEEEKCFCDKWREDDEELGIQIVKDLHRTGSTLCTGPAGDLNQAKLKRILLGYARYNPEVGYCQGFNMLGALILQVMDKDESESIKVMIYLVEGILPTGYFCGSMGGLQADMAVFRELMQTKLPRLAKHLQKLQGPVENAYEPPLTNVFTMQWFLTMFCTCLPMSCVLRVWDLVLIEGSDVLLRTALALWSLLEERVLSARSADDFYGKMGSFSSELLNGHLIDSNGLIEKVVQLGPIADIQKLRDKHLYNLAPIDSQQGLQLYFDEDEPDIDEDSRLAVATVWGIPWGRRGSQGQPNNIAKQSIENKDRIALDISLLKKQYDRLRERQKQAQIILTTACSTASRQSTTSATLPVNQLLSGRPAIVTNKGRRYGPPTGAIPPARKPSLPAVFYEKPLEKPLRRGETLHWRDTKDTTHRRESLSWKEIKAERAAMITSESIDGLKSQKIRSGRLGKSDSSSYSEESDDNEAVDGEDVSSTDTSLCDEDLQPIANEKSHHLHIENNHKSLNKTLHKAKKSTLKQRNKSVNPKEIREKKRPKSWAPSNTEIPFVLMTTDSPGNSADENSALVNLENTKKNILSEEKNILTGKIQTNSIQSENLKWNVRSFSSTTDALVKPKIESIPFDKFERKSTTISLEDVNEKGDNTEIFDISNEGVTNEYFERVNSTERPTKLDLLYSLNEDENVRDVFKIENDEFVESTEESRLYANDKNSSNPNNIRCMDLLVDYSEKSSAACIEEAKTEISTTFQAVDAVPAISLKKEYSGLTSENLFKKTKSISEKRRDPRRFTLTRSSTMDVERRFEALEKRFSIDVGPTYKRFLDELEFDEDLNEKSYKSYYTKLNKNNIVSDHNNDSKTPLTEKIYSADKKIPSTADLEERFENIQQQLVRDRNKMIKSPSDSENTEKQPNLNTSPNNNIIRSPKNANPSKQAKKDDDNESNEKLEGEKILSENSDYEEKSSGSIEFGDIDSVKSLKDTPSTSIVTHDSRNTKSETKSLKSNKEPPDIAEKDGTNERPFGEIKTTSDLEELEDNSNKYIRKPNSEITEEKEEIEETPKSSRKTSDRTSPPSTEELEKRFCALEEQMSYVKNDSNESQHNVQSKKQHKPEETFRKTDVEEVNESSGKTGIGASQTEPDILNDISSNANKFELISEKNTKRRLSEPPSTEDLEKRYEVMKRRMSSRNFETLHKDGLSIELQKTNKNILNKSPTSKHSPPSIENLEERFEKLQNQNESKRSSPPSTENLEERFEKLQNKNESKNAVTTQTPSSDHNLEEGIDKLQTTNNDQCEIEKLSNAAMKMASPTEKVKASNENNTEEDSDKNNEIEDKSSMDNEDMVDNVKTSIKDVQTSERNDVDITVPMASEEKENVSEKKKTINVLAQNANKIKLNLIEELQAKIRQNSINSEVDKSFKKKMAVIEELKTKINPLKNTFLKPTEISSRRDLPSQSKLPPSLKLNDETLESHAASAYRKSEKYEPTNSAKRKMVRRFSDLPSRADLENRLQFLEEQLSKTVCMQRRSSDSEVASKVRLTHKEILTSVPINGGLEYRVQELEKRLKDNRTLSMDVECSNANKKSDPDIEISQVELATDTVAATGKELVRYSSHGEVGDFDYQNPINISINIQMTLNQDDVANKKNSDATKTDDLDKRLQLLEQKLKTSHVHDAVEIVADTGGKDQKIDLKDTKITDENEHSSNQVKEKYDVENSNKTSPKNTQEKNILLNNEVIDPTTANPSSLVSKIDENVQNQNSTEKLKEIERNLLHDKLDKEDNPCKKLNETNQQMENAESVESQTSNTLQERTDCQEQSIFIKGDKELEINADDNQNKESKVVDQTKFEDNPSITNSPIESIKSNLKEDKNHTNSLRQKTQTNDNEITNVQEPVQLNEHFKSQSTKTTEPEICELNDGINIKNDNNFETKINSEIGKFMGENECSQMVPIEVNKKTLVLLLDNEPKAVKVRRLTRANTEELEGLFQALEKQLNDRGQQKICENKTNSASDQISQNETKASQEMSDLAKEIEAFSKNESKKSETNDNLTKAKQKKQEEEFDWGSDPIKYHLKKRTVYLPSTKELEARFRSLERQIKLLEDVEKIDVEQRLIEIERKIKLQYSLSHEKDLNKFLELCEGKDPDEMPISLESYKDQRDCCSEVFDQKSTTKHTSPKHLKEPIPSSSSFEGRYRSLDLKSSVSKQSLKKEPIHPLEMLLDPSPDDRDIPTTGELEHRIRVMEGNICTPSPSSRKSRSQSPPIKQNIIKSNTHILANLSASPTERGLPTAEELEARLEALEKEQCFNFKMQKNFQQFNQKLKDVVSPSLSFEELKSSPKTSDSGHTKTQSFSASKQTTRVNTVSPKTIRFCEKEQQSLSQKEFESMKTIPDNKGCHKIPSNLEGPGFRGIRLMRETSPLRRKGTHTGVPLHTGENINDQLTSIQNTIKSIDSLCEEKPYRNERCQQYIDALFSDSTYFAQKKTSLEDLSSHNLSRSTSREIGPSIKISGQSPSFTRSVGSADSIRSSSPLRSASPLQYRSNRDLRREPSPRRRRDEDREEHESRVRRDNLLPNNINHSHSILSHTSHSSLTKFHKVDSQLIPSDVAHEHDHEESLRHPTFSTIDNLIYHDNTNTSNNVSTIPERILNAEVTTSDLLKSKHLNRPTLPLCQTIPPSLNTPIYTPAKLEIRHTTVTSTFYDRVLTEKQLEKQHHHSFPTNNQSPLVSPLFDRNVKPANQQQITKSPTNPLHNDTINTLTLNDASADIKNMKRISDKNDKLMDSSDNSEVFTDNSACVKIIVSGGPKAVLFKIID